MKEIGIITFQRSFLSYGAVLQNFALQKFLINLGNRCETIDLLRPIHKNYKPTKKDKFENITNRTSASFYKRLKETINNLILCIPRAQKNNNFSEFNSKIRMSRCYKNHEELYNNPPSYDTYITGSDQVWNPSILYPLAPYFLTFVPDGKKKIAYAPSFGVSEIPDLYKPTFKKWLNGLDYISVREQNGAEIIKELTGQKAEVVLDPIFLLTMDEWRKISRPPERIRPYIFYFALKEQPRMMELCLHLKKITGYDIVKISNNWMDILNRSLSVDYQAGPAEFVGWIQNAAIIVTNSFHGTAFSINFNKPFYTVLTRSECIEKTLNSRLVNILNLLELKDRLFLKDTTLPTIENLYIDFTKANILLEKERYQSIKWLVSALSDQ